MLGKQNIIAFVATKEPTRAKTFYHEVLGLRLVTDTPIAIEFDAGGTMVRVAKVDQMTPPPYTVLGWKVADIRTVAKCLMTRGITFERYDRLQQDDLGIWTTPDGHQVAWFKDPDGNTLSLTQVIPVEPPGFVYRE
jgi:catechol 2,3-dioxygenase-like lactoylglutathione lyase family enzyme